MDKKRLNQPIDEEVLEDWIGEPVSPEKMAEIRNMHWITKPEDAVVYDDAFWVRKQRWGTYVSVGADDKDLVTALTEDSCISGTRFYLKGLQEGWPDDNTSTYSGTVGGKL